MRRAGIIGQPLGQRGPDRHFHIAGKPAQDFAHQVAFAIVETRTLNAIERGNSQIDFFPAGTALGVHRQLGEPPHIAQIVCRQSHVTFNAFCICWFPGRFSSIRALTAN